MRIIVDGQNLRVEGARMLSPDELKDTRLDFTFSRDWDRYIKFAQFTQNGRTWNRMLVDNQCRIPPEILPGDFYLHVTGMTPDNHDRVATFYVVIQVPGGVIPGMMPPVPGMQPGMPPIPPLPNGNPPPPRPGDPPPRPDQTPDKGSHDSLYTEIKEQVNAAIAEGMNGIIDDTLSQPKKAADAAKVGQEITQIRSEVTALSQNHLHPLAETVENLKATVQTQGSTQTEAVDQIKHELQTLQAAARLSTLESIRVAHEQRMEETENRVQQVRTTAESATQKAEDTATRLSGLQSDVETSLRRQSSAVERLESNQNRLSERVSLVEEKAGSASQSAQDLRRDVTAIQDRVSRMESDVSGQGTKVQTLTGQVESLERQTKDVLRSIDTLNQSVLSTSVALDRMRDMNYGRQPQPMMPPMQPMPPVDNYQRDQVRDLQDRVNRLADELRTVRGKLDENTGNDRESDSQTRDRLREMDKALEAAKESLQSATDQLNQVVRKDQGRQNAGRVLGILPDGQVAAVDMRMAGQAQTDFTEMDETSVSYIRNNPFKLLNGYPLVDGIILRGANNAPYLLTVNDSGELTLNEFV